MTLIKICGITRQEDADEAVALAVAALGFVLWDGSPRYAGFASTARIVQTLPPFVMPVAVVVSPTRRELEHAFDVGCRVVQVHGVADETVVSGGPWRLVRAVSLGDGFGGIDPAVGDDIPVLLDARDPVRHGGTGRAIDWNRAAAVAVRRRVILAGGLTPDNVADAVRMVKPYGVDVASGVERRPGIKDAQAMQAFVQAVRSVA
jgi:phosphoribosylanthranilate isomerase